ncbi:E3 ubiquitin-protein ligase uhrf1 [Allomyces arbusculus]|nr:E3 ubiquitin-protein ligase uhrf1 [Allomyces arbusculus]
MGCFYVQVDGKNVKVPLLMRAEPFREAWQRIAKAIKKEPNQFKLIFAGKMLMGGANVTLHDLGVRHDSTLLFAPCAPPAAEPAAETDAHVDVNDSGATAGASSLSASTTPEPQDESDLCEVDDDDDDDEDEDEWLNHLPINDVSELCHTCTRALNDEAKGKKRGAPREKCRSCGCGTCQGLTGNPNKTIVCDECPKWYHWACVGLKRLPKEDWYGPCCKRNVKVILEKDVQKKKGKAATAKKSWGHGNACAGVAKKCTIVPPEHVGKIPGVLCGQSWKYRRDCASAGIHRPLVAGICGGTKTGTVSIVVSGGYDDDEDHGEWFYYTGAGGRDLKKDDKNLRTAAQSKAQELKSANLALAKTCAAKVNDEKGAEARDWRKSRAIRVVRGSACAKHADEGIAPAAGYRYDGLYKVVKYWPQKGKSGHMIWRFQLRRDDDEPAPWTDEGKQYIEENGLVMVTDGESDEAAGNDAGGSSEAGPLAKRPKVLWKPSKELYALIEKDTLHARQWKEILRREFAPVELADNLSEVFECPVCHAMPDIPVTPPCGHTLCKDCFDHMIKANHKTCAKCREPVGKCAVNKEAVAAFKAL